MAHAFVEVRFAPNWGLIDVLRDFAVGFCVNFATDPQVAHNTAMAISELLENAVRYSATTDRETAFRIELVGRNVSITVTNHCSDENLKRLAQNVREIQEAKSLHDLYMQRMALPQSGGLGLIRVANEADMLISYEVQNGLVRIQATSRG